MGTMREYDTGLLVELAPGTRMYVSLYTVALQGSLTHLISRIPEAEASAQQLRTAARRAWSALQSIDIPGLRVRGTAGNQKALRLLAMCDQVLHSSDHWGSSQEALENLRLLLIRSQHACLLLGARLPREEVKRLHLLAVAVGFTDDSDEEGAALQALEGAQEAASAEVAQDMALVHPFVVAQTCDVVQELIDLIPDVRALIHDTLLAATEHFGTSTPSHATVGMLLLTRISQDLDGVRVLTHAERPVQALTLDAVIFELSYLIGYFGSDDARADRWLRLKEDGQLAHDDGSPLSIRDFVKFTMLNAAPDLRGQALRDVIADRYQEYKFLCGYKHGHSGNTQRAASSLHSGGGLTYTPEPQQDYLETWLTLVGIWKGTYLTLNVALKAFYQFGFRRDDLSKRMATLLDRLISIDDEHAEIENTTRVRELAGNK